jgi:Viral BACON domain
MRRQQGPNAPARPLALAGVLAISIGANVALIAALLAVIIFARAGAFAPPASSTPGALATTTALITPGTTATTATTTGWLQVAPASVRLGCDNGQQTQFVVLVNTGSDDVRWQAVFSGSADQAGLSLSPRQGEIRAGTSIVIQLQNRSRNNERQGTIRFDADNGAAGEPPGLNYSTQACGG